MLNKNKLFIISFIEGASVMAAEICGAKLLAPFFGSSLYVWSSVMAITLAGLASGYFIGGKLSKKANQFTICFNFSGLLFMFNAVYDNCISISSISFFISSCSNHKCVVFIVPNYVMYGSHIALNYFYFNF